MRPVDFHAAEPGLLADGRAAPETLDDVLDLGRGGFARGLEEGRHVLAEWHGRGREVVGIQPLGRLFARMVELHPEGCLLTGRRLGPLPQHGQVRLVLDRDIAGLAQRAAVDHHVARDDQPQARAGPAPVQLHQVRSRAIVVGAQRLAHGRLGEPIAQHRAIGQAQGLVQKIGFHGSLRRWCGRRGRRSLGAAGMPSGPQSYHGCLPGQ